MMKKFDNINDMLQFMIDNNYDESIIKYIHHWIYKPTMDKKCKYVILYDDMFEIIYKTGMLKKQCFYMELML